MSFISKPKVLNTKLPKNGPRHAADADARKASAGLLAEQEHSEEGGEATQNLRFWCSPASIFTLSSRGCQL